MIETINIIVLEGVGGGDKVGKGKKEREERVRKRRKRSTCRGCQEWEKR